MSGKRYINILLCALLLPIMVSAADFTDIGEEDTRGMLNLSATFTGLGSTGDWAPYFIGSNSEGRHAMKSFAGVTAKAYVDYDLNRRFSWTAGVDVAAGYQASAQYELYNPETTEWSSRAWHPSYATVYRLWAGLKFRGVMLWAGMRDHKSNILDDMLTSGDLILSNNARAIPQIEIGFVDFQNIPFTNGWAQINGTISYGKYTDDGSLKGRYNYWNNHITLGQLFTYKHVHFRSRQDMPFAVTIGMQVGGEYGGTTYQYDRGKLVRTIKNNQNLRSLWEMFFPTSRYSDGFMEGNHVGTWEFLGRYSFDNEAEVSAYFEWFWEDGSGMAKRNRLDGLWGLSFTLPGQYSPLKKVVVEYIDFRDQSGPLHWAPTDAPGTSIGTEATGGDNYYNSSGFNSWSNYGLGLGSPFPVSPLYNHDGYSQYKHNRTHGFHIAATGFAGRNVMWLAKFSYGAAWGAGRVPFAETLKNTSALLTADWRADMLLKGLSLGASVAFDTGTLRGNNFGAILNVTYSTRFDIDGNHPGKKKKIQRQWKSIRFL